MSVRANGASRQPQDRTPAGHRGPQPGGCELRSAKQHVVSIVSGGAGAAAGVLFVARWLISILLGAVASWWRWSRALLTDTPPHRRSTQNFTQQMSVILLSATGAVAGCLFVVLWLTRIVLCSASGVARPVFFRDRTEHPFACLRFSP